MSPFTSPIYALPVHGLRKEVHPQMTSRKVCTAVGACLAFGLIPLTTAPTASADGLEVASWEAFFDPATWDGVLAGGAPASPSLFAPDLTGLVQAWVYTPMYTAITVTVTPVGGG